MKPFARKAKLKVLQNERSICYIPWFFPETRRFTGPPWQSWTVFHRIGFLQSFSMGKIPLILAERYSSSSFYNHLTMWIEALYDRNWGSLKPLWDMSAIIHQSCQKSLLLVRLTSVVLRRILSLKVMFLFGWWPLTSHTRSRSVMRAFHAMKIISDLVYYSRAPSIAGMLSANHSGNRMTTSTLPCMRTPLWQSTDSSLSRTLVLCSRSALGLNVQKL